jgi:hypothetical protein
MRAVAGVVIAWLALGYGGHSLQVLNGGAPPPVVGLDFVNPRPNMPPPQPGPRGENLLAVTKVDLGTGNTSHVAPPFYTNDTLNGYSCIQAFRRSPPTYFIISSGQPVKLMVADVSTGIASTVALSKQLVFFDISWAETAAGGVLYAFAAAPPYDAKSIGIFEVDPVSGVVGQNLGGIDFTGFAEPRPCESGLTASSSTSTVSRFYFTVSHSVAIPRADQLARALLSRHFLEMCTHAGGNESEGSR